MRKGKRVEELIVFNKFFITIIPSVRLNLLINVQSIQDLCTIPRNIITDSC